MDKREQVRHLGRLLHIEVHMVSGYDGALERMRDERRRDRLETLRDDHERHVIDITELLREMGEAAPAATPDVEGLFAPSLSAMKNASSDDDVVQAVRIAEQVTARAYADARSWGVGVQVHDLLARDDTDEKRHADEIASMLPARSGAAERGR